MKKVKSCLCLTKQYAMKWSYRPRFSSPLHYLEVSGQLHALATLPPGKEPSVPIPCIPVTGRGGPLCCETSRLPHFLDNLLTDDGEVVSLTRRQPFTLQNDSWYSFLIEGESTPRP
jgi:hypothetical protein